MVYSCRRKLHFEYPRNLRFECSKCAICCGDTQTRTRHILLTQQEVELISKKLSKQVGDIAARSAHREPYVFEMRKTTDGKCLFLTDEICTIYSLRPLVCRFYPFELIHEENGNPEFRPTEECPAIGSGKLLTKKFFEELILTVNKTGNKTDYSR